MSGTEASSEDYAGVTAKTHEDGFPVIYVFDSTPPKQQEVEKYPWLMVLSWKYDGSANNGMPSKELIATMNPLEDALEDHTVRLGVSRHSYNRTGNNYREFVYYITNQEEFLEEFNIAVEDHPQYPIEINFYNDTKWDDLISVQNMVK